VIKDLQSEESHPDGKRPEPKLEPRTIFVTDNYASTLSDCRK